MRRPVVAVVLAGGLLIALSIPAFGMQTKLSGTEDLPKDLKTIQTYHKVQAAFPSEAAPATVVVNATDVRSPQVKQAIAEFSQVVKHDNQFTGEITTDVNRAHTVEVLNV